MIVFDLPFARQSAVVGGLLWAAIIVLYGIAIFRDLPNDIRDRNEQADLLIKNVSYQETAQILKTVAYFEEEYEIAARFAFSVHITIGLLVGLQAVFFGEKNEPGILSVTRPLGFYLQVFIIGAALFVNFFFFVSGVAIYTVSSSTGHLILGGAVLSFFANALMVVIWENMIWEPRLKGLSLM